MVTVSEELENNWGWGSFILAHESTYRGNIHKERKAISGNFINRVQPIL